MTYITTAEAARRLGVDQRTVSKWIRQGKLDGHRLHDTANWRVNEESVTAMLKRVAKR